MRVGLQSGCRISCSSVGLESEDLAEPGGCARVDQVGRAIGAEDLPVPAANGGQAVDWNKALIALPPVDHAVEVVGAPVVRVGHDQEPLLPHTEELPVHCTVETLFTLQISRPPSTPSIKGPMLYGCFYML